MCIRQPPYMMAWQITTVVAWTSPCTNPRIDITLESRDTTRHPISTTSHSVIYWWVKAGWPRSMTRYNSWLNYMSRVKKLKSKCDIENTNTNQDMTVPKLSSLFLETCKQSNWKIAMKQNNITSNFLQANLRIPGSEKSIFTLVIHL